MKNIQQQADLLTQFRIRPQELDAILGDKSTKMRQLYDGFAARRFKNESQAVQSVYGDTAKPTDSKYRFLKTELKKRVYKLVTMIDFKQNDQLNEYQQATYLIYQQMHTLRILLGRAKSEAYTDLAESLLTLGLKFEIADAVILAADTLVTYHTFQIRNDKKRQYYRDLLNQYTEAAYAERLAKDYYGEIQKHFVDSKATKRWLQPQAAAYVQSLAPYAERVQTPSFLASYALLDILQHTLVNNYAAAFDSIERHLAVLLQKPFVHPILLAVLFNQKLHCCIALKRYEEGQETLLLSRDLHVEGSHNWYNNLLTGIRLHFHNGNFEEGWQLYAAAIRHEDFAELNDVTCETYNLYGAYFLFFDRIEKFCIPEQDRNLIKSQRFSYFFNELPTLNRDKAGLNIPILILQVLVSMQEKRIEQFLNCLDTLSKYKSRHLSGGFRRTALMIKLLRVLPEYKYNLSKINPRIEGILQELDMLPYDASDENNEVEVVLHQSTWRIAHNLLPDSMFQ